MERPQSPLPTHLQVRGVAAPAPGRVFLATDDDSFDSSGALFESNDGGASWIQRDVPFDLFERPLRNLLLRRPARLGVGQRQLPHHGRRHHLGRAAPPGLRLFHGVFLPELRRRDRQLRCVCQPRRWPHLGAFTECDVGLFVRQPTCRARGCRQRPLPDDRRRRHVHPGARRRGRRRGLSLVDGRGSHRRRDPGALERWRRDLDGQHGRRRAQPAPRRLCRGRPGLGPQWRLSRLRRQHLPLRRRRRDLDRPRRSDRRRSVRRSLRVRRSGREESWSRPMARATSTAPPMPV